MNQTFRNLGTAIAPVVTTSILDTLTATYVVQYHGFPVPVNGPSMGGFQVVFAIVVALSLLGFLLSLTLRNYRFTADGTRQDLHAPRSAPTGTAPSSPAPLEAGGPQG